MLTISKFHNLPQEMQDRMPASYVYQLKSPLRKQLSGADLYRAVVDLALSYHVNYELLFPSLNYMPMLVQYARILHLPSKKELHAFFIHTNN